LRSSRADEGRRRYALNAEVRAGLQHGQRRTDRLALQREARVSALGFTSVAEYLRHRNVAQGWTVHAIGAELRTGRRVLPRLMDEARVPRRRPGSQPPRRVSEVRAGRPAAESSAGVTGTG
jgi:hypothetical protein